MKLLVVFFIVTLFSNLVIAGNKSPSKSSDRYKSAVCSKCQDHDSCSSKKCYWHSGHCANSDDCSKYSSEDCLNHNGCVQKQTITGGQCIKRDYQCSTHVSYDECSQNSTFCQWTSNLTCEAVPGFVANCAAKTIEECRQQAYCAYSARCHNNYIPSKSWKYCKEECEADPYSTWVVLYPAYCIDNIKVCSELSIDDCRNNTDHCVVERYYDDCNKQYNQCSEGNDVNYKEKCVAIQYGCENRTVEECTQTQYCKVIDEIGQCYPKILPNCETFSADDCLANTHCCLKEECTDNPQIIECPAKTIEECQTSVECRVIDNGACSNKDFDCDFNATNCLSNKDYCEWIPAYTNVCSNKTVCRGLNYDDCKDYCDVCTWKKDSCKHKY